MAGPQKKIIDFHVHLAQYEPFSDSAYEFYLKSYPSADAYKAFRDKYKNPVEFTGLMDESGVDYAVLLAEVAPLTTGIATNEMIAAFCRGNPRLIPFCTFNPQLDANMGKSLEDLCVKQGFKGLKLYPTYNHFYPNDPAIYPLYAAAERLSIPVLFHTGSSVFKNSRIKYGNPILFDDVAVDFPDLTIIMAHGGRGPWYGEAMAMVRLHANVYIDAAGLPPQKLLEYFPEMERFAHKFVFGTDWPGADMKRNIEKIGKLPLAREAVDKILGENALRILGL